ncbi:NACHT, LRR and PYD domains-containing protein 1 homolog [Misgurnus anguillicaudatus]|uniref:NACHT, LRR and PYD domains-containing protein 1 homolog n=1 Tax=Misgurnus anguillicaudatus TaxID=75329 RepID=UPI003CCF810D
MDQEALNARFVDAHWEALVQRVDTAVMSIADELRSKRMLIYESYCEIKSADTNQTKMRLLGDALHSGGNAVKSAFYSGLETHVPYLLRDLRRIPGISEDHVKSLVKYKMWIQREYEFVTEYNSLPGEHALLSERYTQPLIIMRHRQKIEREEELCFMGESFQHLISSKNNSEDGTLLDALFGVDNRGISPVSVILQGNSGKGKSFTAQKIMLDWASENLGREKFDFVFHLNCKLLNQISEEQSLVELLSINSILTPDQILQMLLKSPTRVLVLIDGFDELRFSDGASNMLIPKNLSEKALSEASLRALLKGYVLPESLLLVMTRSTASDTLSSLLKKPQRFTEIIGFSQREVEEYFRRFFQDEEHFRNAYESVKSNPTLFTSCSIPVICWIICTVIKERFNDGKDVTSSVETTTSIYADFVSTLLEHHSQGLNEPVPNLLKSLGQLAETGMQEMQVLFDAKCVKKRVSDPAGSPFLGKFLFRKRVRQETMFSFMHLSFQEFFTAMYYMSLDEKEFLSKLTERFHSHWPSYGVKYLDENCPLKYGRPELHFFPVIQFLCGLCNKEVNETLEETQGLSVPSSVLAQLEEWILHISSNRDYNFLPYIIHCLYELHEKKFVQKAVKAWGEMDMSWDPLSRADCWALVYCLECCPNFKSLNLNFAAEELKMLQPVLYRTPNLELTVQNIADTDVTDLIAAVGEGKLLGDLRLNGSGLSNQSLMKILDALQKQKTVSGLQVVVKNISAETTLILTDFLQNTEKLDEISLRMSVDCNDAESLCSSLRLFNFDGMIVLNVVRWCSSPQNSISLSEMILKYPRTEMSSINLKNFLQAFHDTNCLTEQSEGFDQQVDALLSHLSSVSVLTAINFSTPVLTEKWASRILFLLQSCSSLKGLSFNAGSWCCTSEEWLPGLLMEEGIKILKESPPHPKCTLNIKGLRCSKSTDCCTYQTEQIEKLDCNQRVTIYISAEGGTEEISPQKLPISTDEN